MDMAQQTNKPVAQGTLTLFTAPAKMVSAPLERHFQKKYAGRYRYARHLFFFDLGLFCIVLALTVTSGALLALPARPPEPVLLRLEQTPRSVFPAEAPKNGEPVALGATVENRSGEELVDAVLRFRLPPHFRVLSAPTSFHADTGTIALGDIPDGATRVVGITALALDDRPSEKIPFVFLQLSGLRGQVPFDVLFAQPVEMAMESVVVASLDLPTAIIADEQLTVPVTIKNQGGVALGPITATLCPQDGFAVPEEPCLVETFSLLGAGDHVVLPLRLVAGGRRAEARIRASVTIETPRGTVTLFDQHVLTRIITRAATVVLTVGTHAEHQTSRTWTIQLRDRDPALVVDEAHLLLTDGETRTVLAEVDVEARAALQKDDITTITVPMDPDATGSIVADITGHLASETDVTAFHLRSAPVFIHAVLPLAFEATGRYYSVDGEQLGRGPLPPMAGQQTTYWIFLHVPTLPEGATEVDIAAPLPLGVLWLQKQSVSPATLPSVTYNPNKREIRWSARGVSRELLAQGVGIAGAVAVTPQANQLGKELTLLGSARLTLRLQDGTVMTATTTPVTTALIGDERAVGKGVVGE